MPSSSARSTASDEAAEIPATIGIPATAAFCTISKETRPETTRTESERGHFSPERAPMALSTTARSGLTALCKALSKTAAPFNVTLNNLLPERIDTERQVQMAKVVSKLGGISYEEARAQQVASIAAGRLGLPEEVGDACAFLCSAQAGFISGQNLQLDGGSYDGLI